MAASHSHPDHAGNSEMFPNTLMLVQKKSSSNGLEAGKTPSGLTRRIRLVANIFNVHYYERYFNLGKYGAPRLPVGPVFGGGEQERPSATLNRFDRWGSRDPYLGSPARNLRFYSRPDSCLPRKYVCGVVPSIVRNISMNALTSVVTHCDRDLRDRSPLGQHLKGSKQARLLSPTPK